MVSRLVFFGESLNLKKVNEVSSSINKIPCPNVTQRINQSKPILTACSVPLKSYKTRSRRPVCITSPDHQSHTNSLTSKKPSKKTSVLNSTAPADDAVLLPTRTTAGVICIFHRNICVYARAQYRILYAWTYDHYMTIVLFHNDFPLAVSSPNNVYQLISYNK